MKINYTDLIAPLQPDGTIAAFIVKSVDSTRVLDPSTVGDKLRPKVKALKVTLDLMVGGQEQPFSFIDYIYLIKGWVDKLDALRVATGEDFANREDFDTDTLVDKTGFLVLTAKDSKNFVSRYLRPEDGEEQFSEKS
jgi:hypothetical protein